MPMPNYILMYYQQISDGTIVVGRWILLIYAIIIKGLEDKTYIYSPRKAIRAIEFIESFVHHSEGRNDLLKLELWQKACISVIFGIVDSEGVRWFREVVIIIARKNGKTLFAAAIIEYMTFLDGEYGSKVFCVAPKLDQADLVYDAFWQSCQAEPEIKALITPRKIDKYVAATNSSVRKIAFNAKKSDGFNPSLTVCDEIASWPAAPGLKQYEVMKSALGARKQPLILSISTAGYVNEGIYDELIKRCTRFLLGDSKERRILPFLYMIDDIDKWNDINELRKSNPNLGVSVSVDYLLEEIAVAEGSLSKKSEFLTKYCNIKQNSVAAWLSTKAVSLASGKALSLEDFKGCYCVGGIDLSQTTDLTACCVLIEKAGELYVFCKFFMPAEKVEEATERDGLPYRIYIQRGILQESGQNFVDYHDCFNWFRELVEKYEILPLKVGYDRYTAQYLVQDMKQYGFHMDDVYQGENLTPVIQEFEGILKDGIVHIGDNDLLKVHFLDSAVKVNAETRRRRLIKITQNAHIDGMACVLDAVCVRQKYHDEIGEQLKNAA